MFVHCTFGHKSHLVSIQNKYILNVKQINRTYFPFTQTHTHMNICAQHTGIKSPYSSFSQIVYSIFYHLSILFSV